MTQTFAQRYWSDFERLAFEVTKECFGITPTKFFRTQESKDGGFDAVFIHELGRLGEEIISHEVLMEAKLRSSRETVGLRTFAATMVIAFNGRTHSLVIVTNREFSPQALEAARDFQWRSRVQLILISQKNLSAWVRPRFEQLAKTYPRELLDDLVLANAADEAYQEIEIPGNPSAGAEPPAKIAFGRQADGSIAMSEIVFTASPQPTAPNMTVIGQARRKFVHELAEILGGESGCALVEGESGSGKSHLIRAILQSLPSVRRCLGMVDLARATTSQQLFLAILAQVLGIEMSSVARQFGTPDAKTFFSIAGGITIPVEIRDAVLSVLTSSPAVFQDRRQLNHVHLEEYLSLVASGGQPGGRLIVFHNLDKSPAEVLEFLHTIIQTLIDKDISVILEISIGGDAPLVGSAQWKIHVELFKRIAALGCFIVPSLNMEGGIELLLEQLPGLGPERARFICERVGYRPLFLYHSALWLKKRHAVAERAQGAHLIEDVEIFFEGLRPEACVSVLDRHIDLWRREIDLPYADSITAATLLNGSLPVAAVQLLVPIGIRVESVLDALTATGLFIPEPRLRGITVSHSLLLERMTATEDGSIPGYGARRFDRSRVARKLLKGIDSFTTTGGTRDLCYSALLAACEQWSEAWEHSQRAGKELLRERQLASASEAFLRGVAVAQRMIEEGYIKGARRRILSLADFLDVEDQRYRLGLRENSQRLESLEVSLRTTRFLDEEPLEEQVRLRSRYLKWRATFTRENFAEALSIARDLFSRVSDLPEIDQELAGHAVAALGITLKAVEREEESKTIFDEGLVLFPRSVYCRMQRWSNLAAFALRHNPSEALQNYRRIVDDLGDSLPIRERVHIEADIAMALFLAGFAREAAIQAAQAINLADANGIPAQGSRGRNILGCVHWLDGRIEDAANLLDRAILDAERSYMERFLWRFRVNLASVAREAGYESIALANARWAEERLVKARESQWGHLVATPSYLTSRWYVALLAIGLVYHHFRAMQDCLRLIQALSPLPAFREHLDELIEGHFPAAVFAGTTHLHGGRIMITG